MVSKILVNGRVRGTRPGVWGNRRREMATTADERVNEAVEALEVPVPQVTVKFANGAAEGVGGVVG